MSRGLKTVVARGLGHGFCQRSWVEGSGLGPWDMHLGLGVLDRWDQGLWVGNKSNQENHSKAGAGTESPFLQPRHKVLLQICS